MSSRLIWKLLLWRPIRLVDQALFAEAFSQTLTAGMTVSDALLEAGAVSPSWRFRSAMGEMNRQFRCGEDLETALVKTGARVTDGLKAALRVGEENGCLAEQLAAFARQCHPNVAAMLAQTVGRSPEVTRFAAVLAGSLKNHRMTVGLIADAGRTAAGDNIAFAKVMEEVVKSMKNGWPLAEAMSYQPGVFDPFFCHLVGATEERDTLRMLLERVSGDRERP